MYIRLLLISLGAISEPLEHLTRRQHGQCTEHAGSRLCFAFFYLFFLPFLFHFNSSFSFLLEAFTFPKPCDMAAVSSSSGLKRKVPPGVEDEVKTNKRLKGDLSKYFLPINRGKEKEAEDHASSPEQELSNTSNNTVATLPLETLLDFDSLVSEDDICARFEALARALFFHYRIRIINPESENTTHHLELLEIEFYLIKPGHADPYCHASGEQDVAGRWYVPSPPRFRLDFASELYLRYFHRVPKWGSKHVSQGTVPTPIVAGEYRSGTRKGLDLTMGRGIRFQIGRTADITHRVISGFLWNSRWHSLAFGPGDGNANRSLWAIPPRRLHFEV